MKRNVLVLLAFFITYMATVSCEKSKGCDNYSPWPSTEAMAAWKEYTPDRLEDLDAYNTPATIKNYFGFGTHAYDSIIVKHKRDSVLICGYLKYWMDFGGWEIYTLTDSPHPHPLNYDLEYYPTVYLKSHNDDIDSTKKAYFSAQFSPQRIPEELKANYCCTYYYIFFLDTEDSPIIYEE